VHPNWPKEQLNRWYACEVSGVNYNGNCVLIGAKNTGGRVVISLEPQTAFIKLINKVSSRGGNVMGAYRNHKQNVLTVKGKCSKSVAPFDVAIERPAAFFGYMLAEKLNAAGITTGGKLLEQTVVNPSQIQLVRQYTHSIGDCLGRSNKNSFGLVAESLFKTIAAHESASKKNGSWTGGRQVISDYMKGLGIDSGQFYIDDASGLSRQNKLSARAITKVLASVYKSKDRQLYKDSLSVGGIDGTIKKYFREKKYKGKVFGKTGYIAGVKSFSGICSTAKGDYIFSILTNGANGRTRPAINDIAKAIIDSN
jgi:D-alanyl-D-alanine carboxypeptidase/D-alanyl-D-alanine-endopeptidase (penicillin-binding protein 4)